MGYSAALSNPSSMYMYYLVSITSIKATFQSNCYSLFLQRISEKGLGLVGLQYLGEFARNSLENASFSKEK